MNKFQLIYLIVLLGLSFAQLNFARLNPWWENFIKDKVPESEWERNFQMSRKRKNVFKSFAICWDHI